MEQVIKRTWYFTRPARTSCVDVIEIGAVSDRNGDVFPVSIFEDSQQLRIEKDFAVI